MATASVTVPSTGLTADSAQHVISAEPLIMLATVMQSVNGSVRFTRLLLRFVASVAAARRLSMASRFLAPTTVPFYHQLDDSTV